MISRLLIMLYQDIAVIIAAAIPIVELRGAIPIGMAMGLSARHAFAVSYLGSTLPMVPILLLLRPATALLRRWEPTRKIVEWAFERTLRKRGQIDRFGILGLFLFVAVPLPGTGVWSGSLLAFLLRLPVYRAWTAIALGNLVAGAIIATLSLQIF